MARVLVVGVGGIGCPCAIALARAGVDLRLCDDDVVDATNLHRQILFDESSVGKPKLEEAARALRSFGDVDIELALTRFLPETARALLDGCDVVVEGADNFPTKFLVADACALAKVPVVHAAAVRLHGTVLAVGAKGKPCYRCVFEDLPGDAPTCETAGVLGPMVGVIGALQADLALGLLDGRETGGAFVSYDASRDFLRRTRMHARPDCALCTGRIDDLDERRYKG
jgi:molybdopterin/thiamine biosynthesis adenylyltransferase